MSIYDIPHTSIQVPKGFEEFQSYRIEFKEPIFTKEEYNQISIEHLKILQKLKGEYRSKVKIGKIVITFDPKNIQSFTNELFFVIGFQLDLSERELVVALMDNQFKTFLTNIDNIVVKETLTIDDMFPSKSQDIMVIDEFGTKI